MPSVAKAKFCRDAYLKNDTSPETIEKIKSLINDTEIMPWLRIPVSDWAKGNQKILVSNRMYSFAKLSMIQ